MQPAAPRAPKGTAESPRPRGGFHWPTFAADAVLVSGGALFANVLNYVYHFKLSRALGPDAYGSLATLLAIAMVVGVIGSSVGTLAMQETARLWATHRDGAIPAFGRLMFRATALTGVIVGIAVALLSVPLSAYLHITDPIAWCSLVLLLVAGIIASGLRGTIQGAHRFAGYAASLAAEGILKLGLGVALVVAGLGVGGAMASAAIGSVGGITIAGATLLRSRAGGDEGYLAPRMRSNAWRLLVIFAASTALLYVDTLFAKHALSGVEAGVYTAAGLVARIIPFGMGLIVPLFMPKAAAARHVDRAALGHLLWVMFSVGVGGIAIVLAIMEIWPIALVGVTFGSAYSGAAAILRLYALDGALLALGTLGSSYLISVGEYGVARWLVGSLVLQGIAMAAYGATPLALLTIAVAGNALVLPAIAALVARSLRGAPQAAAPRPAEAMGS